MGANSQKLKTTEVKDLLAKGQTFFDSKPNDVAKYPKDLSRAALETYAQSCGINVQKDPKELLLNLQLLSLDSDKKVPRFTNAGVLLLTENPSAYIPDCHITAVKYAGTDKFKINDRKDFRGAILEQIDSALNFAKEHIEVEYLITERASRIESRKYPLVAIREALINSVVHRDYAFRGACIYFSIFSDRIEIENPGGLLGKFTPENIEGRSIRRNPLLADLLYRAGYGEKLGSGLSRIRQVLKENQNPPYQIAATNFFSLRLLPRIQHAAVGNFTARQLQIINILEHSPREWSSAEIAARTDSSTTSITRDLKSLITADLVKVTGVGKSVRYAIFRK